MMKAMLFLIFLNFLMIKGNCSKGNDDPFSENTVISKVYHKTGPSDTDTLWVSENDSTVFRAEEVMMRRPDQRQEPSVQYELIHPENNAYYFIYNDKKQLVKEGKYAAEYTYEGQTYKQGGFYNLKNFEYKKNGDLKTIHYQEDGRNLKTEIFDSEKRLTKIIFFNKKSSDIEKIEIYKKGKLKETRIYTGFNRYDTVEAE